MTQETTIPALHEALVAKRVSAADLVRMFYEHIEKHNNALNISITLVEKNDALKTAQAIDAQGIKKSSYLAGIPFVMKDSYVTKGIRTTAASNVLNDYIPQYDATVYRKLQDAGAILLGKMNMDAWGHGGSTENTDFGPTKNPWDTSRVSGGSGGGPAAALAAGFAAFAIGEDTGGSIRNPAAWTNTTGLKVTYGRVSRYGCIAYASSFDTVGPAARSVEDVAYVLETIAGEDPNDATSSPEKVDHYTKTMKRSVKGLTIGIPKEFYGDGMDDEIRASLEEAQKQFAGMGITIKPVSMPMFEYGLPVYYLIGPSETSSNLGRYDGVRYGSTRDQFTEETMRRIMIGTYALSSGYYDAYYRKAQKARTLFRQEYKRVLNDVDALLLPVTPTPPTKIGELMQDPLKNFLADIYTVSQNPVGVPSLALPSGFTKSGLPIGMQLVGNMFSESTLLQLGYHYQKETDWHTKMPPTLT